MNFRDLFYLARRADIGIGYDGPLSQSPNEPDDYSLVYIVQEWKNVNPNRVDYNASIPSQESEREYFPKGTTVGDIAVKIFGEKSAKVIRELVSLLDWASHHVFLVEYLSSYLLTLTVKDNLDNFEIWPGVIEALEEDVDSGGLTLYLWKRGYRANVESAKLVKESRQRVVVVLLEGGNHTPLIDETLDVALADIQFVREKAAKIWIDYYTKDCDSSTFFVFPAEYYDRLILNYKFVYEGWL
jgi:hypothetical protein